MQIGSSGEAGNIRKFYKKATVEACTDGPGWRVMLASRELKTTATHDRHLSSRSLAEALLTPTSTEERIQQLSSVATSFMYCVSLTGVTGARAARSSDPPFPPAAHFNT